MSVVFDNNNPLHGYHNCDHQYKVVHSLLCIKTCLQQLTKIKMCIPYLSGILLTNQILWGVGVCLHLQVLCEMLPYTENLKPNNIRKMAERPEKEGKQFLLCRIELYIYIYIYNIIFKGKCKSIELISCTVLRWCGRQIFVLNLHVTFICV